MFNMIVISSNKNILKYISTLRHGQKLAFNMLLKVPNAIIATNKSFEIRKSGWVIPNCTWYIVPSDALYIQNILNSLAGRTDL